MTAKQCLAKIDNAIMEGLADLQSSLTSGDEVMRARVQGGTAALAALRAKVKAQMEAGPTRQRNAPLAVVPPVETKANPDKPGAKHK
jgi:hypothetical protein